MRGRAAAPWLAIAVAALAIMVIWLTVKMTRTEAADFRLMVIGGVLVAGALTFAGALSLRRR